MKPARPGALGLLLRDRRVAAGWTQEELAVRAGVSMRTLSDLERGVRRPYPRTLTLLAQALGLDEVTRAELTAALAQAEPDMREPAGVATGYAGGGQPAAGSGAGRSIPRQLPARVRGFVGRAGELATLSRWARWTEGSRGAVVISAIGGTAGVGKTALAVRWAHQIAGQFPDGQLYVNLRGYDVDRPVPVTDALAGFLRALAVAGPDIPAEEEERAALYRSTLAGRRVLVVLDNAATAEQVRPLLPGSQGCMVVVTSRDALGGLVARDGARRLDLGLLPAAEAAALLRELIGERAEADPEATASLAGLCVRLPLALRVAAEYAAARPWAALCDLVNELAGPGNRLEALAADGDRRTAVREVFSWSYRGLPSQVAAAFRLLSLHPGPDLDRYAAAALAGTAPEHAQQLLEQLVTASLVEPAGPARYAMHDLLRAYARELGDAEDGDETQRAALTRLFDHYLHTAAVAMDTLSPSERPRRPRIPPPATPGPPVTTEATALAWLDGERACLVTMAVHTATHGWPGHTTRLSRTLFRYLENGGHAPEALVVLGYGLEAARRAGDRHAEATALTDLVLVGTAQGRYQETVDRLQRARMLFREVGDSDGEARALGNSGYVHTYLCRYPEAIEQTEQALAMYQAAGDRLLAGRALNILGIVYRQLGDYPRSSEYFHAGLAAIRETGDGFQEGYVLGNLSQLEARWGHYEQAAAHGTRALELFQNGPNPRGVGTVEVVLGQLDVLQGRYRQAVIHGERGLRANRETGERADEAAALACLGDAELRLGHLQQAGQYQQEALATFREIGDRAGEAGALNGLGEALLAAGQPDQAQAQHAMALALAREIGIKAEQARACDGLAQARHALGDDDQARQHRHQALTLYTELGVPEPTFIRPWPREA